MIIVALYLKMLDFQKDVVRCISYGKTSVPWVIEIFFSLMHRHGDFIETEKCACMVQINRTKIEVERCVFFLFFFLREHKRKVHVCCLACIQPPLPSPKKNQGKGYMCHAVLIIELSLSLILFKGRGGCRQAICCQEQDQVSSQAMGCAMSTYGRRLLAEVRMKQSSW